MWVGLRNWKSSALAIQRISKPDFKGNAEGMGQHWLFPSLSPCVLADSSVRSVLRVCPLCSSSLPLHWFWLPGFPWHMAAKGLQFLLSLTHLPHTWISQQSLMCKAIFLHFAKLEELVFLQFDDFPEPTVCDVTCSYQQQLLSNLVQFRTKRIAGLHA